MITTGSRNDRLQNIEKSFQELLLQTDVMVDRQRENLIQNYIAIGEKIKCNRMEECQCNGLLNRRCTQSKGIFMTHQSGTLKTQGKERGIIEAMNSPFS